MHQVLSVGADLSLLFTRGLILEKAGVLVKSATPEHAFSLIDDSTFDLLVLCHSTRDRDMHRLCRAARTHALQILLLESLTSSHPASADVDHRFPLEDGPASLIATVQQLLAGVLPSRLAPTARLFPFVRSRRPGSSSESASAANLVQPQIDMPRISIAGKAKS